MVLTRSSHLRILVIVVLAGVSAFAQTPRTPAPTTTTTPKPKPAPVVLTVEAPVAIRLRNGDSTEKSVEVERRSTVSLCVTSGDVRVNGWDRAEVRALVDGGSLEFRVAERDPKTEKPSWIFVVGNAPVRAGVKNAGVKSDECLSGDLVELDIPRDAAITLRGSPSDTRVESVLKAKIENISGNIVVRNVTNGVFATTYEGGIMVERSRGPMTLTSASGGIVAFDVGQSETGDVFKARTNGGAVTLQSLEFRQVEASSITGGVVYRGKLLAGGQYSFGSQNGRVVLAVPANTVCRVNAWNGLGGFVSDVPLQNAVKNGQSTLGRLGNDDNGCSLSLKTTTGQLRISVGTSDK